MIRHRDATRGSRSVEPARGERGSALLFAVLFLAVLLLVGAAFLSTSHSERSIAVNGSSGGKAFNIAEAGIEHTRALLSSTDIDALLSGGGNLFSAVGLNDGSYTVDVTNNVAPDYPRGTIPADPGGANNDSDEYVVVHSTGRFRAAERTIDVVLEREMQPFSYGLFARNALRLGGSGVAATTVGGNGDIEFTGGKPAVLGDADAGGSVTDPTYVAGTSTNGAETVSFPDIDCPSTPFGGIPAGPGVNFNAGSGDIGLTGGADKVYSGGRYYYRDFKKSGSGRLIIPVGQRVTILLSGELDIQGSGFVNQNGSAEFLQIFACGSDTSDWSFSGSDEVWLTIYAPRHDLTMTGSGDKHGGFIGDDVRTSGSADYYYDAGLRLPTGRYLIVPGTWVDSGL